MHLPYPSTIEDYSELIGHPNEKSDTYRMEVTMGSVSNPIIAAFSCRLGFFRTYQEIQDIKKETLEHCNFQLWLPDEISESNFYSNAERHGYVLSDALAIGNMQELQLLIEKECVQNSYFDVLSAIKEGIYPIIFQACRHHRLPIPLHFLK